MGLEPVGLLNRKDRHLDMLNVILLGLCVIHRWRYWSCGMIEETAEAKALSVAAKLAAKQVSVLLCDFDRQ